MDLTSLLQYVQEIRASDLHLSVGLAPRVRHLGLLQPIPKLPPITEQDMLLILRECLTDEQGIRLKQNMDLDFALQHAGHRYRGNCYHEQGLFALALRPIMETIPTLSDLEMPPEIQNLALPERGLILFTGPTGSGKSTTLAALIGHINANRRVSILTVEDPVEYIHHSNKAMIHQREVGEDVQSFAAGLRAGLRQDPDVILIGEMRDQETIEMAITSAETGHLVFATLHTGTAAGAVQRIVDVFPGEKQNQIIAQLAGSLEAVVAQRLIRRKDNSGRVAAVEVLRTTNAVKNMIRDGNIHQIGSVISTSWDDGMLPLDKSLADLVRKGMISNDEAMVHVNNKEIFSRWVSGVADDVGPTQSGRGSLRG